MKSISFLLFILISSHSFAKNIFQASGLLNFNSSSRNVHGIKFKVKSCEISRSRIILCRLILTSKYSNRTVNHFGGGHYVKIQDNLGNSYPTRISFGRDANGGQASSILIADTPYDVTVIAENVSSKATKVKSIDVVRIDIVKTSGGSYKSAKFILSRLPMVKYKAASKTNSSTTHRLGNKKNNGLNADASIKEILGVEFAANSCELRKNRTVLCRLVFTSKHYNRIINHFGGGHYVKIQDDTGKSYFTQMSFGRNVNDKQAHSTLIADTPYDVTLIAKNISPQATKVRAINIVRIDVVKASGGRTGSAKLILDNIPMRNVSLASTKSTPFPITKPNKTVSRPYKRKKPHKHTVKHSTKITQGTGRLVGCWKWSNGANIVINSDFTAQNGFIGATWKKTNTAKNRYSITWPSLVDTLALSKDGKALTGKNNIGFPINGTRKSGSKSDFTGAWLWSNGVTVNIKPDSSIRAGALKGNCIKANGKIIIEWPIIDKISVSTNGKRLKVKNQFGRLTAKRTKKCSS